MLTTYRSAKAYQDRLLREGRSDQISLMTRSEIMINPVREIYEMEFRQHDLAKEIDHLRRVKAATGSQGAYLPSLWARIRHGWHVLAQISKIRVEVSFDLREPSESPSR